MLTRIVRGSDYSPAIALSEDKDIFRGITMFEKLMVHNNPDRDLASDNMYTKIWLNSVNNSQDIERTTNSVNQGS